VEGLSGRFLLKRPFGVIRGSRFLLMPGIAPKPKTNLRACKAEEESGGGAGGGSPAVRIGRAQVPLVSNTRAHAYTYTHTTTYANTNAHIYVHIRVHIHICIPTYTRSIRVHICIRAYVYACVPKNPKIPKSPKSPNVPRGPQWPQEPQEPKRLAKALMVDSCHSRPGDCFCMGWRGRAKREEFQEVKGGKRTSCFNSPSPRSPASSRPRIP